MCLGPSHTSAWGHPTSPTLGPYIRVGAQKVPSCAPNHPNGPNAEERPSGIRIAARFSVGDAVQTKLTPEQAEAGRQRYLRELVLPYVRRVLARHPDLRSAMLLVAQYWNDEADDAVHREVLFSVLDEPDLEAARAADWERDEVNTPGRHSSVLSDDLDDDEGLFGWNENGEAISLFAAFCDEGCHQDMGYLDAYSPYALLRCIDGSIAIEVVGTMKRPWLDGVMPQGEAGC